MSDDNKWEQPDAPPPPLFTGKKERDLVKQVNDEIAERIVGQQILYFAIEFLKQEVECPRVFPFRVREQNQVHFLDQSAIFFIFFERKILVDSTV